MGLSSKVKLGNEELKLYLPLLRWTLRGDDGRSASRTLLGGIGVAAGAVSSGRRRLQGAGKALLHNAQVRKTPSILLGGVG